MAGPLLYDMVRETTTTTGTGALSLAGAEFGYRAFSVVGDGNTCFYTARHQSADEWEVGVGTYTASGTTLARTTVLASSNAGAAVNFSAGTKDVILSAPAALLGVTGLTSATPADDDEVAIYDASAAAVRKAAVGDLLSGLARLAGQLGGTAASPDVRGVRETGGPTLLTLGAVADGEFLKRSGSSVVGASVSATQQPGLSGGRLTLTSGVPVTTGDVTGAGTIYYTPFIHNRVALYDGSSWVTNTFTERSLSLSVTSGYVYDVFLYNNAGTLTLEAVEWDNSTVTITIASPGVLTWNSHPLSNGDMVILSTTGALPTGLTAGTVYFVVNKATNTFQLSATKGGTAINTSGSQSGTHTARSLNTHVNNLTTQDGVYVKAGATGRLWLGCFRASGTNTTEDSYGGASQAGGKRYLWNLYNQVPRAICVIDNTNTWTYTTATYRQANGAAGNKVEYLVGLAGSLVKATAIHSAANSSAVSVNIGVGIGIDISTSNSGQTRSAAFAGNNVSIAVPLVGQYAGYPGAGYHALLWLEISGATGTTTWRGDSGVSYQQNGLQAEVLA